MTPTPPNPFAELQLISIVQLNIDLDGSTTEGIQAFDGAACKGADIDGPV